MKSIAQIFNDLLQEKIMATTNRLKEAELKLRALMIAATMARHANDQHATAAELGITVEALRWNINKLRLKTPERFTELQKHAGDPAHKVAVNQHLKKPSRSETDADVDRLMRLSGKAASQGL